MQRIVFAAVGAALFLTVTPGARGQSDFSGAWFMDPSRSESAHQAVPIGPVTLVIKQTPAEISLLFNGGLNKKWSIRKPASLAYALRK